MMRGQAAMTVVQNVLCWLREEEELLLLHAAIAIMAILLST